MIVALEVDREVDLALFSRYLYQIGVRHRISEEGEKQVVWVASEEDGAQVRELFGKLARGEVHLEQRQAPTSYRHPGVTWLDRVRHARVTVALVIITILFYPATFGLDSGNVSRLFEKMTFVAFDLQGQRLAFETLQQMLASGEYWRLLTPMFLHFSLMHIVFNLLWLWEIGRRIEIVNGAWTLVLLVLVTSLSSNVVQYMMSGPALFGGMSGVVFGLLGFSLVWSRLEPRRSHGLPSGIYIFMVLFLVAGFVGLFDFFLPGKMANGAHLGGFVSGLAIGAVAVALEKLMPARDH
ncbi:MAG: rhomboid family intramembrane serine protease [Pseudomonadales bacterium]|nr:rhomboid family intramembrane serine protease [Pseudomonadales bacterium]